MDDFLKEIKKEFGLNVPASRLTVYQPGGIIAIKPIDTIISLADAGKDGTASVNFFCFRCFEHLMHSTASFKLNHKTKKRGFSYKRTFL